MSQTRPLSYAERTVRATGTPADPQARAKATALVQKITAPPARGAAQKGTPVTSIEEVLEIMQKMVQSREAPDMGAAYALAGKRYPNLMAKARTEKPVTKALDVPPHVHVTHPPGIAKSADGTPKSWEEQNEYWHKHPEERVRYCQHFAQ